MLEAAYLQNVLSLGNLSSRTIFLCRLRRLSPAITAQFDRSRGEQLLEKWLIIGRLVTEGRAVDYFLPACLGTALRCVCSQQFRSSGCRRYGLCNYCRVSLFFFHLFVACDCEFVFTSIKEKFLPSSGSSLFVHVDFRTTIQCC